MFTLSRGKQGRKVSYKYKKRRFTTGNSCVNGKKSNNLNTSNIDNIVGNSKFPSINVQTESSFITIINFRIGPDIETKIHINNETIDKNNISEKILSHQNLSEVIDHTYDDNGK